uniref:Bet1-like protein At4g14600 n=1 Tax=Nelumbo nucifera TaxID=4432 RepID=A0A822XYZ0_NELNU|nr:TPA_asm: hypothetical protein HUJ06_025669 [Nelumbo nucifera]
MANSHKGTLYGAGPYRSREGLSTRSVPNSNEIQLQIDPMHGDLDEEITGLHRKLRQLKTVAQEIETEAKFQNDFLAQLDLGSMCAFGSAEGQHIGYDW